MKDIKKNIHIEALVKYIEAIETLGVKETNTFLANKINEKKNKDFDSVVDEIQNFICEKYNIKSFPPKNKIEKRDDKVWFATYLFCHLVVFKLKINRQTLADKLNKSRIQIGRYCKNYEDLSAVSTGKIYNELREVYDATSKYIDEFILTGENKIIE